TETPQHPRMLDLADRARQDAGNGGEAVSGKPHSHAGADERRHTGCGNSDHSLFLNGSTRVPAKIASHDVASLKKTSGAAQAGILSAEATKPDRKSTRLNSSHGSSSYA